MFVSKCDICRKELKHGRPKGTVNIGVDRIWPTITICQACSKPILDFLQCHDLPKQQPKSNHQPDGGLKETT